MIGPSLHPVRVVVARTGLSAHVLRAWERRYGAVHPQRTATNRRLYSDQDIVRLQNLQRALQAGYSIGHVASLQDEELSALLTTHSPAPRPAPAPTSSASLLERAQQAVEQMDAATLQSLLDAGSVTQSQRAVLQDLILPLVHFIGDQWQAGNLRVAHEHLALTTIRTFVGNLLQNASARGGHPALVAGTLSGQRHEIGALIASCLAAAQGWQPFFLGPDLPAEELVATAVTVNARIVALSFVYPGDDPRTYQQIRTLGRLLAGSTVTVVAGGRAVDSYQTALREIGAQVCQSLDDFCALLSPDGIRP